MYAVIIAGGRGTRFWPASRKDHPKQLLSIIGDSSMLQMTVDRLRKTKNVEDIFIVTGKHLEEKIKTWEVLSVLTGRDDCCPTDA